jgi:hypothetical protein
LKARFFPAFIALSFLLVAFGLAENPFLNVKAETPTVATFKGVEWNDEFDQEEYAWTARVTTTRLASAPWGAFFKVTFDQITTKAPHPREMRPLYFFTTDREIVLFNEENPEGAIARLAGQDEPPKFEPRDIYGLSKGSRKVDDDKISSAQLTVKGDRSTYEWTHNSGHFTRAIWQRGLGLVEYAQGYGARRDGFRLARKKG